MRDPFLLLKCNPYRTVPRESRRSLFAIYRESITDRRSFELLEVESLITDEDDTMMIAM
jgi:hypothetical protein